MRRNVCTAALVAGAILFSGDAARSQVPLDPNTAINEPDIAAWQLFIQVNTRAGSIGNNALFETWASDTDTFTLTPLFPPSAAPLALRQPVVPTIGREAIQESGALLPSVPPNPNLGEESRRNKVAFDFIVNNNLYKVSGLRAAFGKSLVFPIDAIEVKANWLPVTDVPTFTLNRVTAADVSKVFHVNTGTDGKQYALVAMHVISKLVPSWTWATFEHQLNPARCDILGCKDSFGAAQPVVPPNRQAGMGYPACAKTAALTTMIGAAKWDAAFANYCLKGAQSDFIDNVGLDVRLGNSVTEDGFVDRSSCMTCHGRAGWDRNGHPTSKAGFDGGLAPLGPLNPAWYWSFNASPPIYEGMPGLTRTGTSADFVWSIPFCAVDDTVTPARTSRCTGQ
ncbi:hypothetical protein [Bradyrhizobium japonicum]|uniref:hypothetical protein n=1 Tax=Bradyrhizobium japonicum TaxID=375 RepID=UPI002714E8BC|nr:hypothetical protein [Bradyrhizobium japonicum]WLB18878.1 hypothetical protein QIH95_44320 [Bradyrhizobium japonicum]